MWIFLHYLSAELRHKGWDFEIRHNTVNKGTLFCKALVGCRSCCAVKWKISIISLKCQAKAWGTQWENSFPDTTVKTSARVRNRYLPKSSGYLLRFCTQQPPPAKRCCSYHAWWKDLAKTKRTSVFSKAWQHFEECGHKHTCIFIYYYLLFIITYFFSWSNILSILAETRWKLRKYLNILNSDDTTKRLEISQHRYEVFCTTHRHYAKKARQWNTTPFPPTPDPKIIYII